MNPTSIKIAYIGGGSRYWAPTLFVDLALSSNLKGEIALYDIDEASAQRNAEYAEKLWGFAAAKSHFKTRVCTELPDALRGADFVVLSILPGTMDLMAADIDIPLEYGIVQCVGDTTGPGGIMRALRAVPIYEGFAHAIMQHCPESWVINYTNPMTLCTAALYAAEPKIKSFGCCHEVFGSQQLIAEVVSRRLGIPGIRREEIQTDVCGVNHFTFITAARYQGRDVMPLLRQEMEQTGFFADQSAAAQENATHSRWWTSPRKVAFDFLRRFGAFGAAGDRHLAEFVSWYATDEASLHRWGVVRTPSSYRLSVAAKAVRQYHEDRMAHLGEIRLHKSDEEAVQQMEAIVGHGDLITNVNLPNRGQMAQMPADAVVETNAAFQRNAVSPLVASPLPAALAELVRRVVAGQALTLQAARSCDRDLALQAMLADPLVTIAIDQAAEMLDRMLCATRSSLPERWRIDTRSTASAVA